MSENTERTLEYHKYSDLPSNLLLEPIDNIKHAIPRKSAFFDDFGNKVKINL